MNLQSDMPSAQELTASDRGRPVSPGEDPIAPAFDRHIAGTALQPDWWNEMKRNAFADYQALPLPSRKSEHWRFANLKDLELNGFDFAPVLEAESRERIARTGSLITQRAGSMIFADNELIDHDAIAPALAEKGVIWTPIRTALETHPEIIRDYFMTQKPHLGSEKFAALHTAFVSNGCLLYVPKGVEIDLPFITAHWTAGANSAVFPHTLVIAEEHSRVTLVETFESLDPRGLHFTCAFNHLFAGEGARINYQAVQNWSQHTLGFQINSVITGRNATVHSLSVNLGASRFRSENQSLLKGDGSHVEMYSLSVAEGEHVIDQRTLQSHLAPHTSSDLLYKNALTGDSRTIFAGMIKVSDDAQATDAYQSNRNLLVSPTAEAHSMPGLEIQSQDVRCSHGSTTGQIDEDELFYLLTRGIRPELARELLVFGFFEEILEKIENEELAANVRDLIQARFQRGPMDGAEG